MQLYLLFFEFGRVPTRQRSERRARGRGRGNGRQRMERRGRGGRSGSNVVFPRRFICHTRGETAGTDDQNEAVASSADSVTSRPQKRNRSDLLDLWGTVAPNVRREAEEMILIYFPADSLQNNIREASLQFQQRET